MKFFKTKIAFLIILITVTPIFTAVLYPKKPLPEDLSIRVFDTKKSQCISMKPEEYLTGVVAAEMPASFHFEALKAQAVAARTYLFHKGGCLNHPEADICTDSSHCQAYKNPDELKKQWGRDFKRNYNKISSAVYATEGEIAVYDDEPISAVFHSTSSGRTENASDVWENSRPYLVSVDSSVDTASPEFASSRTVSVDEFKRIIREAKEDADFEKGLVSDLRLTEGGSVDTVSIGGVLFRGVEIRELFSLKSANFTIDVIDNSVIFDVRGYGHGVGMSQYGANYMAESGSSYTEILKKYYSGIDIIKSY